MTAEAEGTTFELPFQWDDGQYVSPFVRSSRDTLDELGHFIAQNLRCSMSGSHEIVVTDLGCGDGTALFGICRALHSKYCDASQSNSAIYAVTGYGYDLDADLVDLASQASSSFCADAPLVRFHFAVRDICSMTAVDVLMEEGTSPPRRHVVFVYLLTTALEQLKELVMALLPRVEMFISNSWSVPYLQEKYFVKKVGSHWVYKWAPDGALASSDGAAT